MDVEVVKANNNIQVEHNTKIIGRSGVAHQIDVLWRFKQAGVEHLVVIECKNYTSNLTLEKVRNFFGVIHDIGNAQGLIITKTGYQTGAVEFANHYGIGLKVLRKPDGNDWQGRVKNIHINIMAKMVANNKNKPLLVKVFFRFKDELQRERLKKMEDSGRLYLSSDANRCFLDNNGQAITEEMRSWLPKQLDVLDKEDGGPYIQDIKARREISFG